MDDVLLVRGGEALRDLAGALDGLASWHGAAAQPAAERLAFQQFRDDVRRTVMETEVVDGDDVGMIELAGRARLLLESANPVHVGREGGQNQLHGHLAIETRVARAIHVAHAAGAEPRDDLVGAKPGPNCQEGAV